MSNHALPEVLRGVDLFAELPDEVLSDLVQAGARVHTPEGRAVVTEGSDDAGLHVILEGRATVEVGGVRRADELGPGEAFGEISVIDGKGRSATVRAGDGGLDTFTVSPLSFWPLVDRHPAMAHSLLRALSARIRQLDAEGTVTC